MAKLSGGEVIVQSLIREGVEVIFGLPGVQMYGLVSALREHPEIKMIVPRHEQATTYMADGYARASGKVGVATVVPGPGLYNAAAGMSTAYSTSSPILMIAGQIPRATIGMDLGGLHEVNEQLDIVRPVTKYNKRVLRPNEIPGAIGEAFDAMRNGHPRPTHIEMPPETLVEKDEVEIGEGTPQIRVPASDAAIAEAASLIVNAKTPVIYVGTGVIRSEAEAQFQEFTETTNIPVITSPSSKGVISDDHPHSLGAGLRGSGQLKDLMEAADVIIAVGTRFALRNPSGQSAKLIHIDIDEEEIGKHHKNVLPVVGDAQATLVKLTSEIQRLGGTKNESPAPKVKEIRDILDSGSESLEPQNSILNSLRAGVPADGTMVFDMTQMGYYSKAFWKTYESRTYIDSGYSGNLGFAYATALGAKVAKPDSAVVAVCGDGGFMYNVQELSTAVKYGINVVAIVFNDGHYGNVRRDLEHDWSGDYETDFVNPDFVKMAESFGALGIKVDDPTKVGEAVKQAIEAERPAIIDVTMFDTNELPFPYEGSAPWRVPQDGLLEK
ncbi:MAG: Acetolactate synthase isozyme 3 large subunit [Chloroflexota bacterium]|jgi:acetolactate synthase-1/2/3 large subunit|nr:thiamine pyrophosphate-dependent enzyme [Dehalococcoidia bacterium]MQG59827.1 thiamine pyrophosphate-binding protein [SAR202 cluster bacterium]CAI8266083.1 MAG: Acetolactate synthase isozyme 3 large subunit [Chloroflexota bacterium]|tara:strand:+ start:3504 stop:5162 length:1659 start_codon:yes stop_codon:yes gene_type:complete